MKMKAKKNFAVMSAAVVMATVGLLLAAYSMHWITGTLGLSVTIATQISNLVEAGSWLAFAAMAASIGVAGLSLWGTLRLIAAKAGKKAVIA